MRVILTSPSAAQRAHLKARFENLDGVSLNVSSNLTEAYHEAEHRPPKLAVFSEDLAALPEFEVLSALLNALHVRIVVVTSQKFRSGKQVPPLTRRSVTMVDDALNAEEFLTAFALPSATSPRKTHASPRVSSAKIQAGRIVMIGASTGGVEALIQVLSAFSPSCPPTLLVQHTGGSFSAGLARLLDSKSPIRVCEAEDGMTVPAGTAVIAPGDRCHLQLRMKGTLATCRLIEAPLRGGHRPSVDALFESGVPWAKKIAAAILTGMGRDGAEGLLKLQKAGSQTFGQNEATSLVYGMPKVAAELGAVGQQLPLERIGPALIAASSERTAA